MANITRYEPFRELDDLFRGFSVRPMRFDADAPSQPGIKVDVRKAGDAYQVKAELPGVKKDDISVSIDGNQVTIAFTLPHDIDEAKAMANYSAGVLELVLPTQARSSGRTLTVS